MVAPFLNIFGTNGSAQTGTEYYDALTSIKGSLPSTEVLI